MARLSSLPVPAPLVPSAEEAEAEVAALLQRREEVERNLLAALAAAKDDQRAAAERARRIEDMLARVRGITIEALTGDVEEDALDLKTSTISEAIWFAVAAKREGASASEIQAWVRDRGREIPTKVLHTYIHRMVLDERLRPDGAKGARRYFLGRARDYNLRVFAKTKQSQDGEND